MTAPLFVTGITGFVGQSLLADAERRGETAGIVGVSRNPTALAVCAQSPATRVVHKLDVSDQACVPAMTAALHGAAPHTVVHLAGLVTSYQDDERCAAQLARTNVGGTANLWLSIAALPARERPQRFVLASSILVYGWPHRTPVSEGTEARPRDHYGVSKLGAEAFSRYVARRLGIEVVVLRLGFVYGPGDGSGKVIYQFLERASNDETLIVTGSRSTFRDYVFIDDVVRAVRFAADSEVQQPALVNVSSGVATTPYQLAAACVAVCGSSSRIHVGFAREAGGTSQPDYGCILMSSALGEQLYGPWTDLRTGLAAVLRGR